MDRIETINSLDGWAKDVWECVQKQGKDEFTLAEMYAFESQLKDLHPSNNNVRPKIRQQLQILRDKGLLVFLGGGYYKMTKSDQESSGTSITSSYLEKEVVIEKPKKILNKKLLLEKAQRYKQTKPSHTESEKPRKERVQNEAQMRRIAMLEDYACQICGWSLSYKNSKGNLAFSIDVDHIVDKSKDGTEEHHNLIALCPNCHRKKTRGVIKINKNQGKVYEEGKEITLHHDNHLGW